MFGEDHFFFHRRFAHTWKYSSILMKVVLLLYLSTLSLVKGAAIDTTSSATSENEDNYSSSAAAAAETPVLMSEGSQSGNPYAMFGEPKPGATCAACDFEEECKKAIVAKVIAAGGDFNAALRKEGLDIKIRDKLAALGI